MKLIQNIEEVESAIDKGYCKHILILCNGGVDSIYLVKELSRRNCRITLFSVDLGGGLKREKLHQVACYFDVDLQIVDAKRQFVEDAVLPSIRASALVSRNHPLGSSLARPVITKQAVEFARRAGCDAILFSANPQYSALTQLRNNFQSLRFKGYVGAPIYNLGKNSSGKISVGSTFQQRKNELALIGLMQDESCVSEKNNLWCRKSELITDTEEGDYFAQESLFRWTSRYSMPEKDSLTLTFTAGTPTHVDGQRMDPISLIERLNRVVGACNVGRYSMCEYTMRNARILEMREAPAAIALIRAFHFLVYYSVNREQWVQRKTIAQSWLEEVEAGRWHGVFKQSLGNFLETVAKDISGTVVLSFENGRMKIRKSVQKSYCFV